MKNLILIAFLMVGTSSFSQMSSTDVQSAMASVSNAGIEKIYLNNNRTFYTDGSSAITQSSYTYSKATIAYSETSLIINYYKTDAKSEQTATIVIPYSSMERFEVAKTFMVISLNAR